MGWDSFKQKTDNRNQGFVVIVYEENGRIKDDFKIFQLEQLEWV